MNIRQRNTNLPSLLLLIVFLSTSVVNLVSADAPRNSIPRSSQNSHYSRLREAATSEDFFTDNDDDGGDDQKSSSGRSSSSLSRAESLLKERPPWNPSMKIDDKGFLQDDYTRVPGEWEAEVALGGKHQNPTHLEMVQCRIRQVPGDGNCLFHSISTCQAHVVNGTQLEYPHHLGWLYRHSAELRKQAVDCLRQKRKVLFLQGHEQLRSHDLVEAAAAQYGITAQQYCDFMQQDSYWGGGPEIVALSNVLKRPIHVYELVTGYRNHQKQFVLRRMACFGSPKFDKKEPFHILSADSRFPDIAPGKQLASGNHFLAVFPIPEQEAALKEWLKEQKKRRKKRKHGVRGGDASSLFSQPPPTLSSSSKDLLEFEEIKDVGAASEDSPSSAPVPSVKASLWKWWKRILFLGDDLV